MPLEPDQIQELNEKMCCAENRLDALMSRRARRDAEKAQRKADKAKRDAEQLEPSEVALNASMPEAPPDKLSDPRDVPDPWYGDNEDRTELRQGDLSRSN
jgi:hypothetical protein